MKKFASAAVLAAFAGSLLMLPVPSFAASSGETQLAQAPAPTPQSPPAPKKTDKGEKKKDKKEKKEKSKKDQAPKKKKGEDKKKT